MSNLPPATEPPATEPPATKPPATEPPATENKWTKIGLSKEEGAAIEKNIAKAKSTENKKVTQ